MTQDQIKALEQQQADIAKQLKQAKSQNAEKERIRQAAKGEARAMVEKAQRLAIDTAKVRHTGELSEINTLYRELLKELDDTEYQPKPINDEVAAMMAGSANGQG